MNTPQIWSNIVTYALQLGLLVGVGAGLPTILRLKVPRGRLLYWQLLLVACLALPWLRPWRSEVIVMSGVSATVPQFATGLAVPAPVLEPVISWTQLALWLLAAGVLVRLILLSAGLLKLSGYRRRGYELPMPSEWKAAAGHARLLLSDDIAGPVTFGFFRPIVLLPAGFPAMSASMRDAILFHELTHVTRNDWLFTLCEEIIHAIFWCHPAIWWVLGEIQLSREQTVDQTVIGMTQARDPYVDTLLAMAGVSPHLDLIPAPLFLRRRHLKQRVVSAIQEIRISKPRLVCTQTAALLLLATACWFITAAIPLVAQPQMVIDGVGVSVNLNGTQLMHRSAMTYPVDALAHGVEGTVVVQVRLDSDGEVIDSAILSGPAELRKSVQQAVLTWHFDKSAALTTRVVNIDFVKPQGTASPVALPDQLGPVQRALPVITSRAPVPPPIQQPDNAELAPPSAQTILEQRLAMMRAQVQAQQQAQKPAEQRVFSSIAIDGLSDTARDQLIAQLPVHVGDPWSSELLDRAVMAARSVDSHITGKLTYRPSGDVDLRLVVPGDSVRPGLGPQRIGGNVQAANLISQVRPVYPPLAKAARAQGSVTFEATIGKDGLVEDLKVLSGPPLLIQAAMDAVKQWTYRPTLLNGQPVEVLTTIDVNFTLSQ